MSMTWAKPQCRGDNLINIPPVASAALTIQLRESLSVYECDHCHFVWYQPPGNIGVGTDAIPSGLVSNDGQLLEPVGAHFRIRKENTSSWQIAELEKRVREKDKRMLRRAR